MSGNAQLKVCMLVHQDYYIDARVRRYAEALAGDGASVDILCISDSGLIPAETVQNIHVYTIPLRRTDQSQVNYLFEYILAFVLYFFRLSILYLKYHYDIIHVHNMPDFLVFAALIPRLLGARIILDIHDIMPDFYMAKFSCGPKHPLVRLLRLQEKLSASFAHKVITVCQGCQRRLVQHGLAEQKITIIYNTPNPEKFNRQRYAHILAQPRPNFTLIYPGTHAPRYGLDTPIRALPLLIPKITNIRLQIIGQRVSYTDELEFLAQQLGVTHYVEFKPPVPSKEIPALLAAADVGIYPAIREPYMEMAIPEKVLEYALMGLPIVASRLSALEEIFSDKAILYFEPGQIEQFADCILKLSLTPQLAYSLTKQAIREYEEHLSWTKGKSDYYRLLQQLVKK